MNNVSSAALSRRRQQRRPTSVAVYRVAIAAMALGTDPSAICLQWPAPETAHGSAMCRMRPTRRASPLESRKQGALAQSGEPSEGARVDAGAGPDPRWRSRPLGRAGDPSRRLQGSGQRCRNGSSRRHLLPGSLAPGAIQKGAARVVELCSITKTLVFDGMAVESEQVELSPCLRPLAQMARAVFPQAAFLYGRRAGVSSIVLGRSMCSASACASAVVSTHVVAE
jgi:hypothetical protein